MGGPGHKAAGNYIFRSDSSSRRPHGSPMPSISGWRAAAAASGCRATPAQLYGYRARMCAFSLAVEDANAKMNFGGHPNRSALECCQTSTDASHAGHRTAAVSPRSATSSDLSGQGSLRHYQPQRRTGAKRPKNRINIL